MSRGYFNKVSNGFLRGFFCIFWTICRRFSCGFKDQSSRVLPLVLQACFQGVFRNVSRVNKGLQWFSRVSLKVYSRVFFSLVILNVISKGFTAYFKGVFQSSLFQESHLLYSRVSVIIQGVTSIVG